ncbi:MAG: isoleucine--tRNA ligase, partial [Sphingomonadales bacterium]|nr:isoleucine--tRNA ligase [Sphingomonadales bacterium]
RGAKPVMWSPVEKTALAEAEVEYEDIISTQIDVAFEIVEAPNAPELVGAHAVIWTTTPWTIPVNQALAYGADVEYTVVGEHQGPKYLVAKALVESGELYDRFLTQEMNEIFWEGKGSQLAGAAAKHPMADKFPDSEFYTKPRPFLDGSHFVTTDAGTGLVHMSPDHGEDDFDLCKENGINPVFAVDADGVYRDDWAWLPRGDKRAGGVINKNFVSSNGPICEDLRQAGALLAASDDFKHSYPHSWRSKAKIIYRCTPQWFVPMDSHLTHLPAKTQQEKKWENEGGAIDLHDEVLGASPTLRDIALDEIREQVRFVPERGRRRLESMVEGRPDWVLSRQRAWGVPIALYVDRKSGEYLNDPAVNARIVAAFKAGGADAWFNADHQLFLGSAHALDDYEVITDILDVWFDSGCTHAFVLESGKWPDLLRSDGKRPADLYLEGSDQHRGWFQSSLLESCGTLGHAPYEAVLTHGMTLDKTGKKMSKSLGNTLDPKKIIDVQGADILRLWAASVDFTEDHRIGDEILKGVSDSYRKLRNTFRYMLGGLGGFTDADRVAVADMPELERYILHRLAEVDAELKQHVNDFAFGPYMRTLNAFAQEDLSAFFFDIRKDCLYCDAADDPKRLAYRTVMDILFHALTRYIAPVLVFTAEEIWQSRFPDEADSIHLKEWPEVDAGWLDDQLYRKWDHLVDLRSQVTEAIEPLRRDKKIRSSLEADVNIKVKDAMLADRAGSIDVSELCIVASASVTGFADDTTDKMYDISVTKTDNHKCGRCWRLLPDVEENGELCDRCAKVLA